MSSSQLNATANFAGTFTYSPALGTVLSAGTQTLNATFTPSDSTKATSATATNSITVNKATPTITWNTPAAVLVGTALSSTQLNATANLGGTSVAGTFVYSPIAGTVMNTAGAQTLSVTFTPTDSADYNSSSGSVTLTVNAVSATAVTVNINTLANRHQISPFVYGNNDQTISEISDVGYTYSRWGGNDASNYNYLLQTRNSAADWYFETYGGAGDQVQLIKDTQNAGSHALTTMAMMDWVAAEAENSTNRNWSFSVATFGKQCSVDPYNTDAGNGQQTDCKTPVTTNAVTTAYYSLVDTAQECPAGTTDGTTCIDRETWAKALAAAFGSGTCSVPYSTITTCHFYDMDNEPDIWNGTHRDVHPAAAGYDELANLYEKEATNLKTWDPSAVRFGPVFCCWWFYWNGANGADKGNHGGVDFLPWWLNQIEWLDQINGARTLDVLDIHAYADGGPTTNFTTAQLQAATVKVAGYYWDPVTVNPDTNNTYTTSEEPNPGIPFHIPRFKAMVNAIYPGTPLSYTEWGAGLAPNSGSDFSTAIADVDTLGAFGREGLSFASRWGGPSSSASGTPQSPEYEAWKMFLNYDGAHHQFGSLSISDQNNGNSNLFTCYAALDSTGTVMTIMVLNKDPNNAAQVTFNLSGFSASTYVAYTLASTASGAISASTSAAWNASQSFAPYSITLLVINGSEGSKPATEWYLNPDDLMIPASGTATLHPAISSGSAAVTLSSAVFDAYEGAAACSGSLQLTNSTITASQPATITVNAGSTPGFCHFTVTGSDGTATQTQGGWIVVGNPPATLAQSGNNQSGSAGTALSQPLTVTLTPGQSGGSASGAGILFTTSAGTLSNGTTSGTSVIATTNGSGIASVTLTLPSSKGSVTVTAQDQFALGGASVTFTETAN
ncbi:MAG: glycoside hydrolase family 44 protein [Terracidiphilus sp.]